jgi:flagellar protein FliO/FliZ
VTTTTVALLALVLAAGAAVRAIARGRARGARMRVVEKLGLEPRRAIYLVEIEGRRLVVGVGDGAMTVLTELGPAAEEAAREEAAPSLSSALRTAWARVVRR